MTYRPIFVSEREGAHTHLNGAVDDSRWEDCVFCSGLMLANTATGGKYPATLTEAENIRDASGAVATGPTTNNQLNLGLSRRYGWSGQRVWGGNWTGFLNAIPVGYAVAFAGSFAGLPYGHRLRRFLPNYTGGHEVFAIHEGPNQWWWMDPLGPKDGSYQGEYVTDAEIRAFYIGNTDGGTVVKVLAQAPRPTVNVVPLASSPRVWETKADGYLNAYDPYRPGSYVDRKWFPKGSWAYCDAEVYVNQPTRQVPDGGPFLRTAGAGAFAPGLLIVEAEVTLRPLAPPPAPVEAPVEVPPLPVETPPLPDPIPAPVPPVEPEPEPVPEPTSPPVVPTPVPPYVPPTNEEIGQIIGGGRRTARRPARRPGGIKDI